jgi:PPP family 3-phenylpropionic acid transporter
MKFRLKLYNFIVYFASGIIGPYLAVYLYQNEFSGVQVGVLLGTMPLAVLVFQPVWSYLSDILQARRILLIIACVGAGFSFIGLGLSDTFLAVFVWSILTVLFRAPIVVITNAIMLDYLEKESSVQDFSLLRLWGSISFGLSSLVLGSFLYEQNLHLFPWILAGVFFLQAGLSLTLPKQAKALSFSGIKNLKLVENNQALVLFLFGALFFGATMNISLNYQTIHLQSLQAGSWLIGVAISLQAFLEVPLMIAVPALLKRTAMWKLILVGALLLPFRWLAYIFIQDPVWVLPTQALHGFGVVSFVAVGTAYLDQKVQSQWRVTGQGLYSIAMFSIGAGIGQYLAGWIYALRDVRSVWVLNFILSLIGLGLLFIALRKFEAH